MKDSGIEWIGEIPKDKKLIRNKFIFHLQKGKIPLSQNSEGIGIPYIGASDLESNKYLNYTEDMSVPTCNPEDILILWDGARAGLIGTGKKGAISSTMVKCWFENIVFPKFGYWYFKGFEPYFMSQVHGTTIPHMNSKYIEDIFFIDWSLSEQKKIADYLDDRCSKIDELITGTTASIEDYKKLKQAIITEAVTKGLKKSQLLYSGDPNIGDIAEGYRVCKTLYGLSMPITDGPHITPNFYNDGIPFISAEAVSCGQGSIDFDHMRGYISEEFYQECCKKYIPAINDIYMIKSGATTGRVSMVDTDRKFTIWSPLAVFRVNKAKMFARYLYYFLQSNPYQQQVQLSWTFGTQQNIGMRTLEKLKICMPPLSEQKEIADYLDKKIGNIDDIITEKTGLIEDLKKYKKSLIYEVVTGKKRIT